MLKISVTIKLFILSIMCLIILSHYELGFMIMEETKTKNSHNINDNITQVSTELPQSKIESDILGMKNDAKIIYLVTQHDTKSKGKKQIKFSKRFFRQSKFFYLN